MGPEVLNPPICRRWSQIIALDQLPVYEKRSDNPKAGRNFLIVGISPRFCVEEKVAPITQKKKHFCVKLPGLDLSHCHAQGLPSSQS
jgi:hypothetical protein